MSSHAQRPTKTLTSRSSDQPSSIAIVRTACDRRSHSVTFASTRSADVQLSLQYRSSVTLPEMSSSARHVSFSVGRGPRLVCFGCVCVRAISGGARTPRIRPRSRAIGCSRCRNATIERYHSRLPGSDATSDRSAYARFLANVTARPTRPVVSRSVAAQSCWPVASVARPATVSTNDSTCHLIECGRNANGWTSVR